MTKEIDRRLGLQAAESMLPFTVFDAAGKIAGMTTYMDVDTPNRRVEIGSTWRGFCLALGLVYRPARNLWRSILAHINVGHTRFAHGDRRIDDAKGPCAGRAVDCECRDALGLASDRPLPPSPTAGW